MFLTRKKSVFDIEWAPGVLYGDVRKQEEYEISRYGFEVANTTFYQEQFERCEAEARRCLDAGVVLAAFDQTLRCSHTFNILDARGAVSATDRVGVIRRVRELAVACAKSYVSSREALGFPLLPRPAAEPQAGSQAAEESLS
jgi:glycyl-tRNA synthetase alpha chain